MISLSDSSTVPPYEQVRAQLAEQISSGRLAVGTRLPTVRRLAEDLGIANNTVARAYRELEQAGLVETRGRAGSFVSAAGDLSRQRVRDAATEYAAIALGLGVGPDEAVRIVRAVLDVPAGRD